MTQETEQAAAATQAPGVSTAGVPTAEQQRATANNMLACAKLLKIGMFHGDVAGHVAQSITWLEAMHAQMTPAPPALVKAAAKRVRKAKKNG